MRQGSLISFLPYCARRHPTNWTAVTGVREEQWLADSGFSSTPDNRKRGLRTHVTWRRCAFHPLFVPGFVFRFISYFIVCFRPSSTRGW